MQKKGYITRIEPTKPKMTNNLKKINFTNISEDEKRKLKNRIYSSVFIYNRKKRRQRYAFGIAASIVVLISLGIFFKTNTESSSIESFAKTIDSNSNETTQNVQLFLSDNRDVEIPENNTTISYSSTGENVKIGDSKSLKQKASKDEHIVYNTLIVPYGKRSEIKLADGSMVWLNSGSRLIFPNSFTGNNREVYLEGEGIFEVAHNKNLPFIVKTDNHDIEVLGTVFYVSNYTDENVISTVLKSGSVQINYKSDSFLHSEKHIKLTPGTLAYYNKKDKGISTNTVETDKYFSWREGIFIFKKDKLSYIMKKISRYYNIEIIINNNAIANETFSGSLDVKGNVKNVINIIKETTQFQYEIKNNKITIN